MYTQFKKPSLNNIITIEKLILPLTDYVIQCPENDTFNEKSIVLNFVLFTLDA